MSWTSVTLWCFGCLCCSPPFSPNYASCHCISALNVFCFALFCRVLFRDEVLPYCIAQPGLPTPGLPGSASLSLLSSEKYITKKRDRSCAIGNVEEGLIMTEMLKEDHRVGLLKCRKNFDRKNRNVGMHRMYQSIKYCVLDSMECGKIFGVYSSVRCSELCNGT